MKHVLYLIPCLLLLVNCTDPKQRPSEEEIRYQDSLSQAEQRRRADSMRKTNPLLIVPPDSLYTGDYVDKYSNGITKFRGQFRFGERHGQWMSFFPNGQVWSEMHYDKGLRHGPNLAYFETGHIRYSGFYKNDLKDSIWSYFDSTGVLATKVLFKNDRVVKELPLK